jgi:hypothetical protein
MITMLFGDEWREFREKERLTSRTACRRTTAGPELAPPRRKYGVLQAFSRPSGDFVPHARPSRPSDALLNTRTSRKP